MDTEDPDAKRLAGEHTRFVKSLGQCILFWNQTEAAMLPIIGHLLGTDDIATQAVWLALPNTQGRLKLIQTLIPKRLSGTEQDRILALLRLTDEFLSFRNFIAHALPNIGFDNNEQVDLVIARNSVLIASGVVKATPMMRTADLADLVDDFAHLLERWNEVRIGLRDGNLSTRLGDVARRRPKASYAAMFLVGRHS